MRKEEEKKKKKKKLKDAGGFAELILLRIRIDGRHYL